MEQHANLRGWLESICTLWPDTAGACWPRTIPVILARYKRSPRKTRDSLQVRNILPSSATGTSDGLLAHSRSDRFEYEPRLCSDYGAHRLVSTRFKKHSMTQDLKTRRELHRERFPEFSNVFILVQATLFLVSVGGLRTTSWKESPYRP